MCEVFEDALQKVRDTHIPAVFHIEEVTQPQGHSTSGSHERYKTAERLEWEREWDCLKKAKEWITANGIATNEELDTLSEEVKELVKQEKCSVGKIFIAYSSTSTTCNYIGWKYDGK
jgi:TPP-dependent pyruvate/acetoin dehydrogenase alpha subunit